LNKFLSYQLPKSKITYFILGILGLNLLLHIQVFDLDIQGRHAWRQCQTMWNIKNFTESDPNILNPRVSHFNYGDTNIYRYEFPIMQWSLGMAQRVFGSSIPLVRFLLFLITAIGSVGFYKLLRKISFNVTSSLMGMLFFIFGPVVFYYMINPLPDNLALAAGIWYLYHIVTYQKLKLKKHLIFAGISLLVATLAKLPFLMFSIVSIYFFVKDVLKYRGINGSQLYYGAIQLLLLLPAFAWYYWVMPGWEGNSVLKGVFDGKTDWAENFKILSFYSKTMFPQFLLYPSVWLPFLVGIYFSFKRLKDEGWIVAMVFITFLYLILQWDVIGTAHDYYLMPFLPWMYILVTVGIDKLIHSKKKFWSVLALLCFLSAPIVSYKVSIGKWNEVWYNKDLYNHRESLINAVPDSEKVIMLKDISKYVFPYQVNKKGYIYSYLISGKQMEELMLNQGIKFLYSDSREFEQKTDIAPLLDSLILEAGTIRVYRLQNSEN